MRKKRWTPAGMMLAVAIGLTSMALAATLPRLPKDFTFPQSADSPGKVTFSHQSHADEARPSCTSCHPALFMILKKGTPAEGAPIRHSLMDQGRQCGACHDAKKAFGLEKCDYCHRIQ